MSNLMTLADVTSADAVEKLVWDGVDEYVLREGKAGTDGDGNPVKIGISPIQVCQSPGREEQSEAARVQST